MLILCLITSALALPLSFAAFGSGTGPILLDDVVCLGTEPGLGACDHNFETGDCHHDEDAGVMCIQGNEIEYQYTWIYSVF